MMADLVRTRVLLPETSECCGGSALASASLVLVCEPLLVHAMARSPSEPPALPLLTGCTGPGSEVVEEAALAGGVPGILSAAAYGAGADAPYDKHACAVADKEDCTVIPTPHKAHASTHGEDICPD
mmetsp:Transcript_57823/g.114800  ORF Transcript_57823/g.114800 Transcript_57823/m.114800 type:complete len:126 (-) Transcript_57823:876-1253(-)